MSMENTGLKKSLLIVKIKQGRFQLAKVITGNGVKKCLKHRLNLKQKHKKKLSSLGMDIGK